MLKRPLGLLDVFCITAGTMISSGLFVLPGIIYAMTGPSIILSYSLAALLMIPTMFAKAELATAMPKSGASYFFIERSLGSLPGTMAGLAVWTTIVLKSSFALIGLGGLITLIVPDIDVWTVKYIAIAVCGVLAIINAYSVKHTGRVQSILVIGLIAIIIFFCISCISSVNTTHYTPFISKGMGTLFTTVGMVFISFGGLTKVVDISGEVRQAHKNVPLGMFAAFIVVNILYLTAISVTIGVLAPSSLSGSLAPLSLAAKVTLGIPGEVIISIGALFAFITTANAGILSASRSPMAMSRDGLLPDIFNNTSSSKPPVFAIVTTAAFMMIIIAFLSIEHLVETAATMMIILFILVNLSVIIMRKSGFQSYRPHFKVPCYPWLQIATITLYSFLIIDMGFFPLAMTAGFALLGLLWYFLYVRRRVNRKSAFMSLVERVFSNDIQRNDLEQELREISLKSDAISLERFDHIIHDCTVITIEKSLTTSQLFRVIAHKLSKEVNISENTLYTKFNNREQESSSIVAKGIAVPFITIKGNNIFKIILVRIEEGVIFSKNKPPVKTVFVIAGSSDEKSYLLETFMAITDIIKKHGFTKRWRNAYNIEQLRDIVLLSHRQRFGY
jgi:basic amino acid/polyamine antiporter, APA family